MKDGVQYKGIKLLLTSWAFCFLVKDFGAQAKGWCTFKNFLLRSDSDGI